MRIFPDYPYFETALWSLMGVFSILLFFAASMILALLIRQKRYKMLLLALPLICLSYFMEQCFDMYLSRGVYNQTAVGIVEGFAALPDWSLLSLCLALVVAEVLMLRNINRCEKGRITTMSVKEATDSLPAGVCCYAHGGRVLLANHTMETLCEVATGDVLLNGEVFSGRLLSGELQDGCKTVTVGNEPVTVLADGTAWKLRIDQVPYERHQVSIMLALDITETYRKIWELQQKQEKLTALGNRLAKVNKEIMALTAEREVLNAKLRVHDELGHNLLSIKHFILNGGTEQKKAELMESLQRSISFLGNYRPAHIRDEYELMIETAEQLGVTVSVEGELPQTEPHKHILATAIHECFTNTLRHADGDELYIRISEDEDKILARFSNNGEQPTGEIHEKGGLVSLRALVEKVGGVMTISCVPTFAVIICLPKEVEDAI